MMRCDKCGTVFDERFKVCPKCGQVYTSANQAYKNVGFDDAKAAVHSRGKTAVLISLMCVAAAAAVLLAVFIPKKLGKNPSAAVGGSSSISSAFVVSGKNESSVALQPSDNGNADSGTQSDAVSKSTQSDTVGERVRAGKYLGSVGYEQDWFAELTVEESGRFEIYSNYDLIKCRKVEPYSYTSTLEYSAVDFYSPDDDSLFLGTCTQVTIKTPYGDFYGTVVDNEYQGKRVAIQSQWLNFVEYEE